MEHKGLAAREGILQLCCWAQTGMVVVLTGVGAVGPATWGISPVCVGHQVEVGSVVVRPGIGFSSSVELVSWGSAQVCVWPPLMFAQIILVVFSEKEKEKILCLPTQKGLDIQGRRWQSENTPQEVGLSCASLQ